jgi:hypothetical protein
MKHPRRRQNGMRTNRRKGTKMKTTIHSFVRLAVFAGSAMTLLLLAGCTTYVQRPVTRTVYVSQPPPPPAPPVVVHVPAPPPVVHTLPSPPQPVIVAQEPALVVIHTEADFYEPLSPYGEWVTVASYGRVWRPARIETAWSPYSNGHRERTDAGWYWESDEPWAWATYHYGRWDWTPHHGWVWVPNTQWAPAWVYWREGGGFIGWAPLPPSARFANDVIVLHEPAIAPRGLVFVEERRILEPVRPHTVIVNNTVIVNKTVNVTKVKVVNRTVINEGPRVEAVERASGRKLQPVAARELRRRTESREVARRQERFPNSERNAPPARTVAPAPNPPQNADHPERPQMVNRQPAPPPARIEPRNASQPAPTRNVAPRETVTPVSAPREMNNRDDQRAPARFENRTPPARQETPTPPPAVATRPIETKRETTPRVTAPAARPDNIRNETQRPVATAPPAETAKPAPTPVRRLETQPQPRLTPAQLRRVEPQPAKQEAVVERAQPPKAQPAPRTTAIRRARVPANRFTNAAPETLQIQTNAAANTNVQPVVQPAARRDSNDLRNPDRR